MAEAFFVKEYPNGLTLLGQHMEHVSSAAMTLAVRCGASHDPPELAGAASVAAEWALRGAGERNSRQLNDALDSLGCQHHESVQSEHLQFSAAQLGRNLLDVLEIYADMLLSPRLEEDSFEPCRALIAQDIDAIEDEPARKCSFLLREKFFPHPLGRMIYGSAESLAGMEHQAVRRHVRSHLSPAGAILAVAGAFDRQQLQDTVERRFGSWTGRRAAPPTATTPAGGSTHIEKTSAQTHIALAHKTVVCRDERYYPARLAEAVLSRGMGSRLFTEVREKRGLAYHVSSSYAALRDFAGMFTYAGTRPDLAAETFKVTVEQLRLLSKGIELQELSRAKTQLRSALVMQGASTSARAETLAGDWHHLGRPRSLEEVSAAIEAVAMDDVMDYLQAYPAGDFTILTIGPEPLDAPAGRNEEKTK